VSGAAISGGTAATIHHHLLKVIASVSAHGPQVALGLIRKNLLHNARWYLDRGFDRKHGTTTSRVIALASLEISSENVQHGVYYEPTPTRVFRHIMRGLTIAHERFTFCDLGSGLGRTLLLASDYPFHAIVGVEFSETLHRIAEENIRIYRSSRQKCFAIRSAWMDAAEWPIPDEPTVFFLYNPFLPPVMTRVLTNIKESLDRAPREVVIVYYNPLSAHVIEGFGFLPHKQELSLPHDFTRKIQRRVTVFRN
jgi:histone methylation protein DOT1